MLISFILYHIIIFPKDDAPVFNGDSSALYSVIKTTLKNLQCKPLAVNGTGDHIHILTMSSPLISADELVDEIRLATNEWMAVTNSFPLFTGWQRNYVIWSLSKEELKGTVKEIEDQKLIHKNTTLQMELSSKGVPV